VPQDQEGFSPDTLFQIGSVTKIFTTNPLGQMASQLPSVLTEQLPQFTAQMGPLPTNVGLMTLEEPGDFTSGVPITSRGNASRPRRVVRAVYVRLWIRRPASASLIIVQPSSNMTLRIWSLITKICKFHHCWALIYTRMLAQV
jgi:hypothetical protein